jgi:hypothetical protein
VTLQLAFAFRFTSDLEKPLFINQEITGNRKGEGMALRDPVFSLNF